MVIVFMVSLCLVGVVVRVEGGNVCVKCFLFIEGFVYLVLELEGMGRARGVLFS